MSAKKEIRKKFLEEEMKKNLLRRVSKKRKKKLIHIKFREVKK